MAWSIAIVAHRRRPIAFKLAGATIVTDKFTRMQSKPVSGDGSNPCPVSALCTHSRGSHPTQGAVWFSRRWQPTLEVLAGEGLESFYTGARAEKMAEELEAAGVPLCAADLAIKRRVWADP